MGTFRITSPDGNQFNVTAPEGATQDQVLAYAKQQFDQRSAAQATQLASDREKYSPTVGMSTFDKLAAGTGQAITNAGRGIGQLFGGISQADIDEAKGRDSALEATTAGKIGNVAGNVAMFAPTAMIPGANSVTGAATVGAIVNALTTTGNFGDRATAGAIGAAGGAAGQILPRLLRSAKAAAEPLTESGRQAIIGRLMNRAADGNAPAAASNMRNATSLVPGSMPTAAEVSESGGIAALQRAMSAADPEAYAQRGMQQSSARLQALRGIAGDDATMAAAVAARDAATKSSYAQAKNTSYLVDDSMEGLLKRPIVQKALVRAKELAKNDGRNFGMSTTSSAPFKGAGGIAEVKTNSITGHGLQDLKMAMDDLLKDPASGIVGKEAEQARGLRGQIVGWMENANPEFKAARTTYSDMSQPINQMQVGHALVDKLTPALSDHGALAKETAAAYASALRNSDSLVKNATGFKGVGSLDDVMGAQNMGQLNSIAQDLARKANAQDIGRGVGSNTFQNFAMDNLSQSMGMPGAVKSVLGSIPGMSPTMTMVQKGASALGGMAYKSADDAIRRDMAQALLSPQAAARLMDLASKPQGLARLLQNMPAGMKKNLPPEDLLKLLQVAPGIAGVQAANSYAN